MGVQSYDRNITPFLKDSNPLESGLRLSKLKACGVATKGIGVPMFEERSRVGVQEAGKPSNGICRTVGAMIMVPAGHLALVFVATHMWGNADHGLVNVAITKTAAAIAGAVLHLVVRLEFEAFVTECWLAGCGSFVQVMEGDIVFIWRTLSSSYGRHVATANRGTSGRLRVDVIENASGEPRVDETSLGLEEGIVVHPDVLFQGLKVCVECGTPTGLRTESHNLCCDTGIIYGVDVLVHKFLQAGLGVQHV